ncbi:HlyD family secretion protein [Pseudomonas amygdali pv. lachrymans]|uniref:HlyD family secretion protein n=1 Tax=Pseudomonas amygdali pv. lachrymans TaxID=53707 RepID=A0A0P9SFS2_PSEAV|nr:HlyD family secretion protein [Pseudomonas amygdali pv. lachrymans]
MRIVVDADQPMLEHLRPGMSVVVSIDTSVEGDEPSGPEAR